MKIASSTCKALCRSSLALAFLLPISMGEIPAAHAANAGATPPPTLVSPPPVANTAGDNSALVALPPPMPMNTGMSAGNRMRNLSNLAPLEEKVSDSVRNTARQLGTIENVNFDDLNTARQAVAKLDILIEIEKRLAELDKIRSDRSGEKSLAAAIPMSALSAPPLPMPKMGSVESMSQPGLATNHGDVSRIIGAAGHYTALVQGKAVRVGDTLPDGSSVIAISAKQVETKTKDGTVHQLKVKGVDEVYGHTF
jgi:hypothetical protein